MSAAIFPFHSSCLILSGFEVAQRYPSFCHRGEQTSNQTGKLFHCRKISAVLHKLLPPSCWGSISVCLPPAVTSRFSGGDCRRTLSISQDQKLWYLPSVSRTHTHTLSIEISPANSLFADKLCTHIIQQSLNSHGDCDIYSATHPEGRGLIFPVVLSQNKRTGSRTQTEFHAVACAGEGVCVCDLWRGCPVCPLR